LKRLNETSKETEFLSLILAHPLHAVYMLGS